MADPIVEFGRDGQPVEADGRLDSQAFHRNHSAIRTVLLRYLNGKTGDVLEAGSGTGQHVVDFARHLPDITWWPSDLSEHHRRSIAAWRAQAALANLRAPLSIDLTDPAWCDQVRLAGGPSHGLAVFCANVIHIAPWRVTEGLLSGAARYLLPDGHLLLYGPFKRAGRHTAPSNAAFDDSLRQANPEWGVRDLEALQRVAADVAIELVETVEMPANNLVLVFGRNQAG